MNFNGLSADSDVFTFNACLPPSAQPAPFRISTSTTSITLGWNEPLDDGGCPITGYAIYRDEADLGVPSVEVNSDNDAAVRGIPTLRQLVVTSLPSGAEGQYVRFSARAFNREGWVDSISYVAILFAAVPSKPGTPPQLVEAESNSTSLTLTIGELTGSDTGNSDIQGYSLEID
jgi:hypothetical protein